MANFNIHFDNPWLLFVLIPLLLITIIPFLRIPKKFRNTRNRVISVTLHCLVAVLLTCLLAGVYFTFTVPNRDNEIMIVVDASDSNDERRDEKDAYIQTIIGMCDSNYKVGIVTFGFDTVYAAPLSFDVNDVYRQYLSSQQPDASATDIAGALQFAADQFENPSNAKIVLLSDGFETDNAAVNAAKLVAASGVKIDTVNFGDEAHGEIQMTASAMPEEKIIPGSEVNLELTIESSLTEDANVTVTVYDNNMGDQPVSLTVEPGEQTVEIPHIFQTPGEHDIIFLLTCPTDSDYLTENNVCQAYLNIVVPESVLILESVAGEATPILSLLPATFTRRDIVYLGTQASALPATAKELCEYDQVILCNIANSDLTAPGMPANFDEALYSYVYDMGGSVFTYGGENSEVADDGTTIPHAYNRDDMAGSLFQQMLPVEAVDYTPPSAVMIVIDNSGSMSMGKADAAYDGAEQVLDALYDSNPYSYCGVTTFAIESDEQVRVLPVSQRDTIREAIDNLRNGGESGGSSSGGTVFSNAIRYAGLALNAVDVPIKHMILLTDGNPDDSLEQPEGGGDYWYGQYIDYNRQNGITLSIITFGASQSDQSEMRQAAEEHGGGKYYPLSTSETDLESVGITMRQDLAAVNVEAIAEGIEFHPQMEGSSPIFNGLSTDSPLAERIPILTGYYGTRPRDEATVPLTYQYVPIYAEWQFGAGKVGSFMSDIGGKWSSGFLSDPSGNGSLLITNIIDNLAPLTQPEPDVLDFTIRETTQNYTNRIDVYADLAEGESVRVSIAYSSLNSSADVNGDYAAASQVYGFGGVPVTDVGNGVSFNFDIVYTGIYRILIEKLDAAGNVIADVHSYRTFSYSSEYDGIRDDEAGVRLLSDIAQGGNGVVQTDPVQTIMSFERTLDRTYDPALVLLILSAVFILLDIAVLKFKFKWPHEIIRERKLLKESGTAAQEGEKH